MIKAIFKNGVLYLIEPVPVGWYEGQEVCLLEAQAEGSATREQLDAWEREMNILAENLGGQEEWSRLEAMLADADAQAKALVRKEMEL